MFKKRKFPFRKLNVFALVFLFILLCANSAVKATGDPNFTYERRPVTNKLYIGNDSITGALTQSLPLNIPAGRNGMQPDLSLNYNSQNNNNQNIFGYGWSDNIPYIERINKKGVDTMFSDDYFYSSMDGELNKITSTSTGQMQSLSFIEDELEESKNVIESTKDSYLSQSLAFTKEDGSVELYNPEEVTSKRTRNSKTYLIGWDKDNKTMYKGKFYSGEVNYFDTKDKEYKEIDTTLNDHFDGWTMDKASYTAEITKTLENNFVKFNNQGQELYFSLDKYPEDSVLANKTVFDNEWSNKQVVYKDALGKDIDISISLNNEVLIKEAVINNLEALGDLTNKEYYDLTFKLTSNRKIDIKVGDKLLSKEGIITTDEMVEIIDDQGVTSYIWPPYAQDSSEISNYQRIQIEYKQTEDGIYLTKKLPVKWLEEAKYPVRTDASASYYLGVGDGSISRSCTCVNWSDCRDGTTGSASHTSESTDLLCYRSGAYTDYSFNRGFYPIDTSGLPDYATIDGASLNFYVTGASGGSTAGYTWVVVDSTQASTTSLSNDDYDSFNFTDYGYNTLSSDVGYAGITLNSSGKSDVSTTGFTKLAVINKRDFDDYPHQETNWLGVRFSEYSGTSYDPYLAVTYSETVPMSPIMLEVEKRTNPVDVTDQTPEFTAIFRDQESQRYATHYRIEVTATSSDWDNLVWDSGKTLLTSSTTEGDRCEEISYGGSSLDLENNKYYWRIKFWNDDEEEGEWSIENAYFTSITAGIYGAKIDNGGFVKYEYYEDNFWQATDKNGTLYTFGYATSTKQDDSASSTKISKWMLEEVKDTNGNYIKYEYYKDNGQIYPSKIKYTGYGDDEGIFEIEFLRESRSDNPISYKTGFSVKSNYRINEIQAKINGEWVRKYELDYVSDGNSSRSLLDKITEIGKDESSNTITLPATEFDYQTKAKDWTEDTGYSIPEYFASGSYVDRGVRLADVNGDGLDDIVIANNSTNATYLNKGDGTGWDNGGNFGAPPLDFVDYQGWDQGVRLADVNGDGLVDIIKAVLDYQSQVDDYVYINTGGGWSEDTNWSIPISMTDGGNRDGGVRFADVNGDGLIDILKSYKDDTYSGGTETKKVYICDIDNKTWTEDTNYTIPEIFSLNITTKIKDLGVRLIDVNNDGLVDIVKAGPNLTGTIEYKGYVNKGDGTGWASGGVSGPSILITNTNGGDMGVRFADVNGDGLVDMVQGYDDIYGQTQGYVYINNGSGWVEHNNWQVPVSFVNSNYADKGAHLMNVDGDGAADFVYSWTSESGSEKDVYIADPDNDMLLSDISHSTGRETSLIYKGSPEYLDDSDDLLNPELPFILQTVYQQVEDDGLGNISTTTYEYQGGDYYYNNAFDKRFAGFYEIAKTDAEGNISKTYYHQGNSSASTTGEFEDDQSKIGKIFRTEVYDDSNNLYTKTINKWENFDLGDDRDFVYMTNNLEMNYDGDTDHKDKGTTFTYETIYGNLTQKTFWGEVTGSDNGTFTDTGSDLSSTTISYAASTTLYIIGLPSQETTYDQSNNKVQEKKYYYDNLSLGSVNKGNLTKQEMWKSGSDYIDTEKTYNSYGLVTQEKDPRDKTTNYTYDVYNLYVATSTNALNQSIDYYYDYSSGKAKKTVDFNDRVFEVVFDGLDRVKEEKQPDISNPSTLVTKASYTYYDNLSPRSIEKINYLNSATSTKSYSYLDGFDRTIQERKQAKDTNQFSVKDFKYNKLGLLEKESLPYFSTGTSTTEATVTSSLYSNYSYDPLSRVITVVNAVGTTTNAYDQWALTTTDAESNIKDVTKDAYENLIKVEEHNSTSTYITNYEYNLLGKLIKIEDALDNERNLSYDGLGRLLTSQDLHASGDSYYGTTTYAYDDSGNTTSKTDPAGQVVNYTYDDINRVLTENYTGGAGTEVEYGYDWCSDGAGKLCTATSSDAITNYTYNPLGLLKTEIKKINSVNYSTEYDYDRQGNTTEITYPDNSEVKYEYNVAGLLERVLKKESGESSYAYPIEDVDYNALGQITFILYENEAKTYNTYDDAELYRLKNKFTLLPDTGEQGVEEMLMSLEGMNEEDNLFKDALNIIQNSKDEILISDSDAKEFYDAQSKNIESVNISSVSDDAVEAFIAANKSSEESLLLESNSAPRESTNMYSENLWFTETITYNESFEDGLDNWVFYSPNGASGSVDCTVSYDGDCSAKIEVATSSPNWWDAMFYQEIRSDEGVNYKLKFKAKAATNTTMLISFSENHDPWYSIGLEKDVNIGTEWKEYEYDLTSTATDEQARILFGLGENATTYWIDDVELVPDNLNMIQDSSFEDLSAYTPWDFWSYGTGGASGTYDVDCTNSTKGDCSGFVDMDVADQHWQVQLFQYISVSSDDTYILTFDAKASSNRTIYPVIAQNHDPWYDLTSFTAVNITTEWETYAMELDPSQTDSDAKILFYLGHNNADINFDNIHLWVKQNLKVLDETPEFSAIYDDPDAGDISDYYQIQVIDRRGSFDDPLWDSGKTSFSTTTIEGDRTVDISYGGDNLALDGKKYYWRAKLWDDDGDEGPWTNGKDYFMMYGHCVQDLNYTYDKVGNITKIEDKSYTNTEKTTNYTYDDLYRLTMASTTNDVNDQNYLQTYTYNPIGNITNKSDIGNYSYNGHQGTSFANPHAATTINNATQTYDNNGNLTNDGIWTHTWDYNNRMATSTNGTTTLTYAYDEQGSRIKMTTGGSTIITPNKYYSISSATTTKNIFANGQLIATIENDSIYYVHADHLTGSNVITDDSGYLEELIDYYPFGSIRLDEKEGSFSEKRKFTGHEYDTETGLNYMMARYYNGNVGRFVSVDPVYNAIGNEIAIRSKTGMKLQQLLENPQALNSYSYSYNNPLIYRDQSGEFAFLAPLAAYAVAYAPVWVPAAITTVSAIGAGVTSWFMGESVGYMMEGNHQAANQSLNRAQTTLGITAVGVGGVLVAGEAAGVSISNQNQKNNVVTNNTNSNRSNTITVNKEKYNITGHAQLRMQRREITSSNISNTINSGEKFKYYHDNTWKTGYYDSGNKIFVGSANNNVTTVINNVNRNYINNLKNNKP